jgi:hypothetical protein
MQCCDWLFRLRIFAAVVWIKMDLGVEIGGFVRMFIVSPVPFLQAMVDLKHEEFYIQGRRRGDSEDT